MDSKQFHLGLRAVTAAQPYGKKLQDDEIAFLWMMLPGSVKEQVSSDVWAYACNQALLDPTPNKSLPVHMRILSYVFRIENENPNFTWGLKGDLRDRMANAAQFNPHALPPESKQVTEDLLLPAAANNILEGLM
jgi:hypothetical protein